MPEGIVKAELGYIERAAGRRAKGWPALRALMIAAPVVAAAQVALGVLSVLTLRRDVVAVGHFAGAMTMWGTWIGAWIVTGSGRRSMVGSTMAAGITGLRTGAVP
jgi:heme A synthase